jgi:helix-turn-helix, Psq domain
MPQTKDNDPLVLVDPLDLQGKTSEERIQLALSAISRNGLKASGRPVYPIREAARAFGVSKTTLTARFNGRKTRVKAHEDERKLSVGCEEALVEWVAEMGRRYMPLHASAVAAHASLISGEVVGESWVHRFRSRHPELKVRWAMGLEKCRAQALNRATVEGFYGTLQDLLERYNIPEENIYNMDEKGIQLGMGQRVRAFVDRDQKCVFQVEDGDRELVTIIECVSADGQAIRPSAVFKGARRNMEWGRDNPCQARSVWPPQTPLDADMNNISHSLKGWTDQELGSA